MKWLLLLVPTAASADEPYDQYMTDLPTCFYAAENRAGAEACVGVYAGQCMQEADGGMSNLGMSSCLQAEAQAWDLLLNAEYRAALDWAGDADASERDVFPEYAVRVDQIKAAQRAWIPYRDANCAMQYGLWGSGSMRYLSGATCLLDMTAARTIDLYAYYHLEQGE